MPRPTSTTAIPRHDLGAIAYEYMMSSEKQGYIAGTVLPLFETKRQAASYPVIPIEAFLKPQKTRRTPRGAYPRSDYAFGEGSYSCKEDGWEEVADDVEVKLYSTLFDVEELATLRATDVLLRGREIRVAAKIFNPSNFTNSAVAVEWSKPATATPGADIKLGKTALRKASGLNANAIIMSKPVFDNLLVSSELKDYLKFTSPHLMEGLEAQRRMVAKYFGVDEVLVPGGMYDAANKGQPKDLEEIWDDEYVWLGRIAVGERQDLKEPVVGRTFLWTEDSPEIINTESYREEQVRGTVVRVRHSLDEAFVFKGAGYLLTNITEPPA